MSTPSSQLTIGLVQMQMTGSVADNDRSAEQGIREAAAQGAQLVCLPELYRSRYFCQTESDEHFALAESVPGESTHRLSDLARELGVVIVASLFERRASGLFHNTAAVLDPAAGFVGKYRKMHIPDDPRYYEKYYFTPGDLGFKAFDTGVGRLGVLVCWDQWYPEAARLTALNGASVLIYPTAIGWHPEEKAEVGAAQASAWETIQRSHAIANGCFVVAINRTGFEPEPGGDAGIEFFGSSFVCGPDGVVLAKASADTPQVIVTTIDTTAIERARIGWPFFRDRRIDAYEGLTRRFIDD